MFRMAKYLLLMGLILFNSCEEMPEQVDYCEEMGISAGTVPFTTFEDISKDSISCYLREIEYNNWYHPVLYIINDQQALDTLLDCSSYNFNFNFEEYTLLIGYFYTNYGPAELSNQEVTLECGFTKQYLNYSVTVDVLDNNELQEDLIQHNTIIPKIPGELRVNHWVKRNRLYLDQDTTETN